MFQDSTDEFRFNQMVNEKDFISNMLSLDSFMSKELKITRYMADTSYSLTFDSNYPMPSKGIYRREENQNQMNTLKVSNDFFTTFDLNGDYDLNLIEKAFPKFANSESEIPIILGRNFKKYYKKGDILYDTSQQPYRIYGFFNKGSYYIAPNRISSMEYLDNYFVIPKYNTENTEELIAAFEFFSTYYITDNELQIYQIIDKSKELNLFALKSLSFEDECRNIQFKTREKIIFNSALLIILLIFALIGFIGNLIQFISDSSREFAIHLLCGASESHIILRVGMQIVLMIFLSNIAPFAIFGAGKATIITSISSLIIGAFILLYPIMKINLQSIIMILRRHEE